MGKFYKILETARNEKDVENYYREYINSQLKKLSSKDPNITTITSPYKTDGYLKYINKDKKINLNCLFEFKYDIDFNNKIDRTRVIIQSLYYLKKFELAGEFFLPTTLFIGDKNECFYLHTNKIIKYLGYKLNWSIAPSEASSKNDELLKEMCQDTNLDEIFVIDIDENFNFGETLRHINDITNNTISKIRINSKNVHTILPIFLKKVLNENKLSINDEVNLFIQTLVDRNNNYQQPKKPNILVTKGFGEIKINGGAYKSYMNFFDTDLFPSEKEILTSTQDRLIQDETRRKNGEFYTPTLWSNEANKTISEQFGDDWKEKYIIWDCASGTANLTRDHKYKELYCSTLNASDIETINQSGYNTEATKFQYDFLNDGIINNQIDILNDDKLPQGLKNALLEGKEIILFINPPYGTSGDNKKDSFTKKGINNTNINKMMKNDDWGRCSEQLYAQFLYKIYKLNKGNISICLFSPPLFLTGGSYEKFRFNFLKKFNFKYGFLMNSSEFQDTSEWGISFSIWSPGLCSDMTKFNYTIKINNGFEIISNGFKNIYNIDNKKSLNDFVTKTKNNKIAPNLSSALNINNKYNVKLNDNSFGYMYNKANNVLGNISDITILTSAYSQGHGVSIDKYNYNNVSTLFTARKLIKSTWINQKDEYMAPTEEIQKTDKYKQFESDSIVYSLFNTSSNQSSMRQVEYKGKLWDIKNEFFFMSKDELKDLAEQYKFDELYKDSRMSDERYVYNLLKTTNLSTDAQDVLETARELVRKSFEWRKLMHHTNPEYHLDAWDAGWYQIKKILNEHFKSELLSFVTKYKEFENRMRPQVYQLGFLNDDNREYDDEYQQELKDKKFKSLNLDDDLDF